MKPIVFLSILFFSFASGARQIHFDYYDTMGPMYEDISISHSKVMLYGMVETSPIPGCNAGMVFPRDYFPGLRDLPAVQQEARVEIVDEDSIEISDLDHGLQRLKDKMSDEYRFWCKTYVILEAGYIHDMYSSETGQTERNVLSRILFRLDKGSGQFYLVESETAASTRIMMDSLEGVFSTGYYLPYQQKQAYLRYLKE